MRCHVALTPAEAAAAPLGIVVDVMRATSTIAQALAAGYRRVLCCAEIEDALALRAELGDEAITGGERDAKRVDAFDAGASPREFREPQAETLILSTTNGTRSIVAAAEACEQVVLGALLNLDAVAGHARESGVDYTVDCAGYKGAFAIDDAYCAGRIIRLAGGERTDAAIACELVAERFPNGDRRDQRAHLRPAWPRGGHRLLRAGERARRRAALQPDGRPGGRSRRVAASQRQAPSTWVPPSQRSTGAASTRSAFPARTLRPRGVSVTRADRNSRGSPRGGGAGSSSTSGTSSASRFHAQASPRNAASSRAWLARKSSNGRRGSSSSGSSSCRSVRESPVRASGSSSSNRHSAAPRWGSAGVSPPGQLDEPGRLGCPERLPGLAGERARMQRHRAAPRPERLEPVRRERPEVRVRLDQLEPRVAGKCQRLQQLQLVVEVVLEPEDDVGPALERPLEEPVAPLERLQQRALEAPAALAQEPRPHRP